MLPDALAHILAREPDIRMAYVIPDFQNPTGRTWSRQRREQFMDLISRTRIPVIEDNPYGELRFEGPPQPSLMTMDPNSQVIGLGTFSKILCPGLRIGWITASPALLAQFDLLKQGTDLHTAQITQACVARYLERHDLQAHIQTIRETYRRRRDVMLAAIGTHLGDRVSVNRPEGGLFLWMRLPEGMDARQLLTACLKQKVAFVPGESFHPQGGHQNTMRLNFSNASETDIREGISRISSALDAFHRPAAWV
jgi:2-aminoadipate transaminase